MISFEVEFVFFFFFFSAGTGDSSWSGPTGKGAMGSPGCPGSREPLSRVPRKPCFQHQLCQVAFSALPRVGI